MPINHQLERRDAIRSILQTDRVATQERLIAALQRAGLPATQSSVSRDLKELGAVKTAQGYRLPEALPQTVADRERGVTDFHDLLRELTPAGPNLLVIKTAIGAAQQVALGLDQGGWPDVVGTVAGDDTVFVATSGATAQRRLMNRMPINATAA